MSRRRRKSGVIRKEAYRGAPTEYFVRASRVPSPGDGSCMFHSLAHFLGKKAQDVREEVVLWMDREKETFVVDGTPLVNWVEYSHVPFKTYLKRMRSPREWGGHTELVAAHNLYKRNISVYEPKSGLYKRIERMSKPAFPEGEEMHLLFSPGHYDALSNVKKTVF